MKNTRSIVLLGAIAVLALSGCSLFGGKKDVTFVNNRAPNSVVDDGAEPVDLKASNEVMDGGTYRENEDYSDVKMRGGLMADAIPAEHFYSVDREKHAPVGKTVYVVTDDHPSHCLMAKFTVVHGHKKLIVYSKSPVPNNYCIYQKTVQADPQGFSIYAENGGVCKPAYIGVEHTATRNVASVEGFDKTVSMTYCVESVVSWGRSQKAPPYLSDSNLT